MKIHKKRSMSFAFSWKFFFENPHSKTTFVIHAFKAEMLTHKIDKLLPLFVTNWNIETDACITSGTSKETSAVCMIRENSLWKSLSREKHHFNIYKRINDNQFGISHLYIRIENGLGERNAFILYFGFQTKMYKEWNSSNEQVSLYNWEVLHTIF